ncbi:histidinol-phosphate transaminase [Thalassospira sp. SM2505]|uniref:Histidinol-phosphate aminotransferase n=1 Tax=Thalassospira profundimaris TaxID=502049 RepID=A0A367X7R9_9PROT|nr:histidinol-phosphate transaminase [Thalassospira profundimaris]RCK49529.1 histidinol-phosphate aminotransferase [Thalassospira profundimaris]
MSAPTPRPGILDIAPYKGGKSSADSDQRVIKLSSNEGALGPSPKAMEALRNTASRLHRYPDGGCDLLRHKLAEKYGLEFDQLVCGAGSDELLTLLIRAYAGPGDEVLYSQHGFLMYPIAAMGVGATPVTAPETNMTTDVDALLAAVTDKTKIVFVANPNNPTGTYITDAEMKRLRDGLREDIVLVVDAAYAEFMTGQEDYSAGEELVKAGNNTVMTRTFSKIYGLGGIRLGWCYAPPAIADVLQRLRNPFNVPLPTQEAGVAALEDDDFVNECVRHNAETLAWFRDEINAISGLKAHPSYGNFVMIEFPTVEGKDADAANDFMMARGVIPRKIGAYGLSQMLRVSIGTKEEMEICLQTIKDFVNQ